MTLQEFFHQHPKAALAFSGGADSAYLLWAGRTWGEDVRPYYVSTPFQPAWELADARRLASELGAPLTVVELDVLACPQVAANPEITASRPSFPPCGSGSGPTAIPCCWTAPTPRTTTPTARA